jgi:CheY-like chemotaxis protein
MPFGKLKHMRTLLIDDDEFVRDSLQTLFESRGCFLLAVRTAEDGIEALRGRGFDVIITDYRLPGMDGLELCRALSRTHPRTMKIMITAYSSIAVRDEASAIGIHELIEKPITTKAIEASLSRLLGLPEP